MRKDFLEPLGITQRELAQRSGMSIQRINGLINGKRGITADTALCLAEALGTTAEMWMNLQSNYDLSRSRPAS